MSTISMSCKSYVIPIIVACKIDISKKACCSKELKRVASNYAPYFIAYCYYIVKTAYTKYTVSRIYVYSDKKSIILIELELSVLYLFYITVFDMNLRR